MEDPLVARHDEPAVRTLGLVEEPHLAWFEEALRGRVRHVVVLKGGMSAKARAEVAGRLSSIPAGEARVVLATGRYIGEGFDEARLDTLFLALPVSWKGTPVQYAGRVHRTYQGKTEVRVYDYVDRGVPVLLRMFEKRLRGYRAIGYASDGPRFEAGDQGVESMAGEATTPGEGYDPGGASRASAMARKTAESDRR